MNEDFSPEDFERYVDNEWSFERSKGWVMYGLHRFWEYLWDGESESLETKYGTLTRVSIETDYDEGRQEQTMIVRVGDRFFKKIGYYDSWDSTDWDGKFVEVKPVEKTFIDYLEM